jgi:alpha-glucosidase (family GH31 glycosyl hydrolase)
MEIHNMPEWHPLANPQSIVQADHARFTVLTERLIRLEYDPEMSFDDRPSQIIWNRELPKVNFSKRISNGKLFIETDYLLLENEKGRQFKPRHLSIFLKANGIIWHFGDQDNLNLKGTYRTLDKSNGKVDLGNGLISLSGWSIVDDSKSLFFNPDGWISARNKSDNHIDIYFFGYGFDYSSCIADYQKLAGAVPLIPRWALGNWWSRYWAYSQSELLSVMNEFEEYRTPLSVCVIDMDWHITHTGNTSSGWTGFSWNKTLIPKPDDFLKELHSKGLKASLNLHPAEGIHSHEDKYHELVDHFGADPNLELPIPFDSTDKIFLNAYFDLILHPLEDQGIDFWWIDWQQGDRSNIPGLDPLFWLNHQHSIDSARSSSKRPFIFSRWTGLGGHRYPIGFSGDTFVTWDSLDFQPYFTSTASNVAFGWWSHDIGGHMGGVEDPELYLRWVQFGVFSPILRLHSTKNRFHERRPWGYDAEIEKAAIEAMQLRKQLIPYLYTAARKNQAEGLPLILPMYYLHPKDPDAYQCPSQYYFGSDLVAAPFTKPMDKESLHSRQVVWLPEGTWSNFFTGERFAGGGWYGIHGLKNEIPVFAKEGSIIPLDCDKVSNGSKLPDELELIIFAGKSSSYTLYEDDGTTQDYQSGEYSEQTFEQKATFAKVSILINKASGSLTHLPSERSYKISIFGIKEPEKILINGQFQPTYSFSASTSKLEIVLGQEPLKSNIYIEVENSFGILNKTDRTYSKLENFLRHTRCETYLKSTLMDNLECFINDPHKFLEIAQKFSRSQLLAISEILGGLNHKRLSSDPEEAALDLINKFINR